MEETESRVHSRWGFVYKDGLERKEFSKLSSAYRDYIDSLYEEYNFVNKLDIELPPLSEMLQPQQGLTINPLIQFGFRPSVRYTYLVDLKKEDKKVLEDCEQTTRQAIRKLSKLNRYCLLKAKAVEEDFQLYNKLHQITYTRTGRPDLIIYDEYTRNIFFNLIPKGICNVYFLKDMLENEVVAAVVILLYKNTAYYWWGASSDNKKVGVNKYLLYEVMMDLKNNVAVHYESYYFEMGGAYPYVRDGKWKGLNDFKKSFEKTLHPIYKGEYYINLVNQ